MLKSSQYSGKAEDLILSAIEARGGLVKFLRYYPARVGKELTKKLPKVLALSYKTYKAF